MYGRTDTFTRNNEPLFKLVLWFVLGRGSISLNDHRIYQHLKVKSRRVSHEKIVSGYKLSFMEKWKIEKFSEMFHVNCSKYFTDLRKLSKFKISALQNSKFLFYFRSKKKSGEKNQKSILHSYLD